MALRQIRIGSLPGFQYDDADYSDAIETSEPIKAGPPVDPSHVVRLSDIAASILGVIYPIGGLYISTLSTNPNTLLGFGTWVAFGAGKVLVGIDVGGDPDFDTVEETGGAKTSTPDSHVGTAIDDHTKVNGIQGALAGDVVTTETHTVTQPSDHAALNVVQPYIVVYIWKRTV